MEIKASCIHLGTAFAWRATDLGVLCVVRGSASWVSRRAGPSQDAPLLLGSFGYRPRCAPVGNRRRAWTPRPTKQSNR